MQVDSIKQAYIGSDNLYEFVKEEFSSYEEWLEFEADHAEMMQGWEHQRVFRIVEQSKQGLIQQALKGNAAAVSHLRSLLGLNALPGRPKGKNGDCIEKQQALERRLMDEYASDVDRMTGKDY